MIIDKIEALTKLKPNTKWVWRGDDYDGLEWLDENQTKPTEQEILDKQTELQTEYNNNKYQRDRAEAYPSIQEQLDMMYHDQVNGTTTWKDKMAEVKTANPKP